MYAQGHVESDPLGATDVYTKQRSVGVDARNLAVMATGDVGNALGGDPDAPKPR